MHPTHARTSPWTRLPTLLGVLAALPVVSGLTDLRASDFANGTYRITAPGVYRLLEDIEFAPRPDNEYWNEPGDPRYPMSAYYLGFFAAITVETSDVEIDLNGHTVKQSQEFYLVQRFFNAIELADRVFVDNEGVSSLNYQTRDKEVWREEGPRVPAIASATNVYIHDGVLGLSSHSGIHGNLASRVRVHNLVVRDWEVSGIQCNGCVDVEISNCEVGPTSSVVPVSGTFSSARFMSLYTDRLIPYGFGREDPPLSHLLQGTISFADRPGVSYAYTEVFARSKRATHLFTEAYMGRLDEGELEEEDAALLAQAQHVFGNRAGEPDGSVAYGILFNHAGLPHADDNFYGAGLESRDVVVRDTVVHGLSLTPVEVPGVQTVDGAFVQGVARDMLRIFDVVTDDFRSLINGHYEGNFLSDVYFALWALSNDFYKARVYDSSCGNFGSNSTLPWTLFGEGRCANGLVRDPTLTGRDVSLLQKKYFGGLAMSQDMYDWATTPGASLHTLFVSQPHYFHRRQTKHWLVCDLDTMFHPMQGVIGIKVRWTYNVSLDNVLIANLTNKGDDHHWLCRQEYKLPENNESFMAMHANDPRAGADIHGIEIVKSEQVSVSRLTVEGLDSDEGRVFGIEVAGDVNDRSDYMNAHAVSFEETVVRKLRAGHGKSSMPIVLGENKVNVQGITTDDPVDLHNNFRQPKVFVMYEAAGAIVNSRADYPAFDNRDVGVVERWMARTSVNTEEKLLAFRGKVLGFLSKQYGLVFHQPNEVPLREAVWVEGTDSYVAPLELVHQFHYKGISICSDSGGCTDPCTNCFIHDYPFLLVVGSQGLMLHGAFAGEAGQFAPAGNMVFSGFYSFEGIVLPGADDQGNLEVQYFGTCPVQTRKLGGEDADTATFYIDCVVESDQLGHGRATGAYLMRRLTDDPTRWELWGYPTQVYQDNVPHPKFTGVRTTVYEDRHFPTPDVTFNWIADGVFPVSEPPSQRELIANLDQHHWLHEAGIEHLRRWTSISTDSAIRQLRYDFMLLLRDVWGLSASDPDLYLDEPLTNQIDLGGGNTIQPYAVNHWSNQRMITKKREEKMLQFSSLDARLHEGGFRLFVGRAGIHTPLWGYLPYGSMCLKGVYTLEGDPDLNTHEINFTSTVPIVTNEWSTTVYELALSSHAYGEGYAYNVVPMAVTHLDGFSVNSRGAFVFKNAEGRWPGVCPECPLEGPYPDDESIDLTPPVWPAQCVSPPYAPCDDMRCADGHTCFCAAERSMRRTLLFASNPVDGCYCFPDA